MPTYTDTTWIGGLEISVPPVELHLRQDPLEPVPTAPPGAGDDFVRSYANDQLNSRVNVALPPGRWKIAWKADLPNRCSSSRLLHQGERILVCGPVEWYLYDGAGNHLQTGSVAPGGVTLDTARGLYYMMNKLGYLVARKLSDGALYFLMGVDFGNNFMHPFVAPRKRFLLATGIELQRNPHDLPPELSSLQLMDLGEQPEVSRDQVLKSFHTVKTLKRKSAKLFGALNGNTFVIATEDRIYFADTDLNIRKVLSGSFAPLAMSLDERGNMYMIALSRNSMTALLASTPEGELFCARELRGAFSGTVTPPIVGFDHSIYLLFRERVQAFAPDGLLLWNEYAGGEIGGAVVTPDGSLVVAVGPALECFNKEGERTILQTFPNEALCSQPLLTSGGSILIATEEKLCCLVTQ